MGPLRALQFGGGAAQLYRHKCEPKTWAEGLDVRGGLDDALDRLARRDELRRRTAGEAIGAPPAVHELVEAIAGVVGRNPKLEVTVGVEGVGDPTLLHFYIEDGVVQVNADSSVAARVTDATTGRHADFEVVVEEPTVHVAPASAYASPAPPPAPPAPPPAPHRDEAGSYDPGDQTRRISYDDRDRYDPGTGYDNTPYAAAAPHGQPASPAAAAGPAGDARYRSPFAATPPPAVPPQTPTSPASASPLFPAPAPASPAPQPPAASAVPEQRGMPRPLAEPIPLHVDSAETEQAARRLSALLRENPTLLRPAE